MTSATRDKELYSRKAPGLTFEAFDEKVITWCRKKCGDNYAVALWKNELAEIINLDLTDDEDNLAFELQCAKVYDIRYPMSYVSKERRPRIRKANILDKEISG